MWFHLISHFLILSRKPIGIALESSCLKAGTDRSITGLVLILVISNQCTYTCLHDNTPFYVFISHILTFVRFPEFYDWRVASLYKLFAPTPSKLTKHAMVSGPRWILSQILVMRASSQLTI